MHHQPRKTTSLSSSPGQQQQAATAAAEEEIYFRLNSIFRLVFPLLKFAVVHEKIPLDVLFPPTPDME